ncbi:MAG: alpha/beta hydrolase, partial [Bacilli bacterium]
MYYYFNNINIYYEKHGNGEKSIIILPGWGNTRETFNEIINYFKSTYTVYIFDYPGFGNSIFPNRDLTIFDYAYLIKNFMDDFKIEKPIIIGHSFGGRLITLLSGYYNISFQKIILIDSAGIKPKKSFKSILKLYTYKLLKNICKLFKTKKLGQIIANYFSSTDYRNLNYHMKKTFVNIVNYDLVNYLKDIKDETLIIWGEKDLDT